MPVKKTATNDSTGIVLPPINKQSARITLVGDSPLICHKWSEKAKREMLDKQMKKPKQAKDAKDPWQDFCESLYWLTPMPPKPTESDINGARFGFPSVAFKNAAVDACSQVADVTKVLARSVFHIVGEFVEIKSGPPQMREDMVRVGMGTADIRHRGEFQTWTAEVDIIFNASVLSIDQIVNLFNLAGFGVGIGEWRPQKDGSNGRFHVALEGEV